MKEGEFMRIKPRKLRNEKEIIIDVTPEETNKNDNVQENTYSSYSGVNHQNIKNNNQVSIPVVVILCIVLSLISGGLGAYLMISTRQNTTTTTNGITTSTAKLTETNSISDAVSKVYDAVVVVEVYSNNQLASTGTGFVYKKANGKAYLMTNNHVISGGKKVKVLFQNGDELEATTVGSDTYSDIAVLSVKDSDKIVAATTGASDKSKVGDTVFTVGSPEGSDYAGTVTKGILSAKDRLVEVALSNSQTSDYYMQVLQTDAAINPGNSGGALLNMQGELIGINCAKIASSSVEGTGYAIPISKAQPILEELMNRKTRDKVSDESQVGYLGIKFADLSREAIQMYNMPSGAFVMYVAPGEAADNAGIQKNDIVTKLDGQKVSSKADINEKLQYYSAGEEIQIQVARLNDGEYEEATVTVTLSARPDGNQ